MRERIQRTLDTVDATLQQWPAPMHDDCRLITENSLRKVREDMQKSLDVLDAVSPSPAQQEKP